MKAFKLINNIITKAGTGSYLPTAVAAARSASMILMIVAGLTVSGIAQQQIFPGTTVKIPGFNFTQDCFEENFFLGASHNEDRPFNIANCLVIPSNTPKINIHSEIEARIDERAKAIGTVRTIFTVPAVPEFSSDIVDADISTEVSYNGILRHNSTGAIGPSSTSVWIGLQLVDTENGAIVASKTLLSESLESEPFSFTLNANKEVRLNTSSAAEIQAKLVRGRVYRIEVQALCSSDAMNATGPLASCEFMDAAQTTGITVNNVTVSVSDDDVERVVSQLPDTGAIIANDNANKTTLLNAISNIDAVDITALNNLQSAIISNDNSNTADIKNSISATNQNLESRIQNASAEITNNINANVGILGTVISTQTQNMTSQLNQKANEIETIVTNNAAANTMTITNSVGSAKNEIIGAINSPNDGFWPKFLRTQIEADLAEADNATFVAWYVTPTDKGGHLDFVQQIVTETLANMQAAGADVSQAQAFLDTANAEKTAGNYRAAYALYRKAYKSAQK